MIVNPLTTEYNKVTTPTLLDWRAQLVAVCFCERVIIITFQFCRSTAMFIAQELVLSRRKGQCDKMWKTYWCYRTVAAMPSHKVRWSGCLIGLVTENNCNVTHSMQWSLSLKYAQPFVPICHCWRVCEQEWQR
jgi:hypothetical protein